MRLSQPGPRFSTLYVVVFFMFIYTAVVLSMFMLLFIDTAIVLSMLMLLFIFVIVCGLFEWRQIYIQGFHRLFIHMYIYCYWISSYQE